MRTSTTTDGRCAGFTLLELLVVLALIGLVMAIAAPRLVTPASLAGKEDAARQIAAALRETRAAAVARNAETDFVVDVAERRYRFAGGEWRQLDATLRLALYTARSQLVDDAQGSIRFFPDGSSSGGHIDVSRAEDGEGAVRLNVDWLTGTVDAAR